MGLTIFDPFGSIEIPEGATGGDRERRQNEFYQLVGRCIKEWANVEQQLFELCAFALQAPENQAAIVYYRCPTIDARLSLTNELLLSVLPKKDRPNGGKDHPYVQTWNKLSGDIKDRLQERNLLAHSPVREVETVKSASSVRGTMSIHTLASWLEIVNSKGEKLRGKAEKPPLRTENLQAHLDLVKAFSARLAVFHGTIAEAQRAKSVPSSTEHQTD